MFGSSSTTSSLASGRCRASVSVSMFCIVIRHAEDNLNVRWRWTAAPVFTVGAPHASRVGVFPRVAPVGDGGGAGTDAELGVDPPDVVLHGLLGQEQAGGDLAVGLPVRDQRHDLNLTRRQAGIGSRAVKREHLTPIRSRILPVAHVTSGVSPVKGHVNEHSPTWMP